MKKLSEMIQPAPGKIAVQVKRFEERTSSGLYLSERARRELEGGKRPTQGRIVAIGRDGDIELSADEADQLDDELGIVPFLKVGDLVVFGAYNGTELTYGRDERIIILRESDVLAKLDVEEEEDVAEKVKVGG